MGVCPGLGRVYIFPGEAVTGSSQTALTESGTDTIVQQFPGAIGAGETPRYGASLAPIGDTGACSPPPPAANCLTQTSGLSGQPDGAPDLMVGAPGVDAAGANDTGAVFLVDAGANAAMTQVTEPQAASASAFGTFDQGFPAVGDLGAGGTPDVLVATPDGGARDRLLGRSVRAEPVRVPRRSHTDGGRSFRRCRCRAWGHRRRCADRDRAGGGGRRAGRRGSHRQRLREPGAQDDRRPRPARPVRASASPSRRSATATATASSTSRWALRCPRAARGASTPSRAADRPGPRSRVATLPLFRGPAGPGAGAASLPRRAPCALASCGGLRWCPASARLKRGSALRLSGSLKASAGQATCQRRQKIAVQRRKLSGGRFQTFEVAVTTKTGSFRTSTRPSRTYVYRARVSQTARCMGATSKTAKVVVRKAAKGGSSRL